MEKQIDLDTPMETVRPDGTPNGKNCPHCGYGPCKYEFCLACGQRIYRSIYSNAKNFRQFKNVDEMCEKIDAIAKSDPNYEESNRQFEILTGRKPETLTQERERVKISMTELLEKEPREDITKLENKKKTIKPEEGVFVDLSASNGTVTLDPYDFADGKRSPNEVISATAGKGEVYGKKN